MDATRILAIRHGETDWNVVQRVQGHLDIPLNDAGREQAQRLARTLAAGEPIQHIYSSDSSRALDTARAVSELTGAPLTASAALRERCFGDLQGRIFAEVAVTDPEHAERWRKRDPHWQPPGVGGETLLAFQARVTQAVQALAAENIGHTVAVFTHGGVLDLLYRAATGLGLQDFRTWQIGNTAINRLLWSPASGLTLIGWADDAHLETAPLDERAIQQ
ncbi:MAG: histidine phosphatase family protein [Burkholderiaceae bacterium]|jgi:probable phosphoglycerate mutase|nr:histidine phosphatase family protein [Burkholderiaceae bacterium]